MAVADTLADTKSLGNVRHLASQARSDSAPAAEAITQLQQQQDKLLGLTKTAVAGIISTLPTPAASTTPPGDVSAIVVSGSFDPISGYAEILLGVTPPSPPFAGCHIFAEVPDQSANPAFTIGTSDLSGTDAVAGRWSPVDLGQQPYVASQQPWSLTFPIPDSADRSGDISCRVDLTSYTTAIENALVQAGQAGASPSAVFTLKRRVSNVPGSGTNVAPNVGSVIANVLTADNSTGKLKTPVFAIIGSAPLGITGWVGQLVLTYGTADPTVAANQFPVGPIFNTAGPVYAVHDGISVPHSFAVDTPSSVQNAILWARTGLVDANGNYQWNNIIPNVTPSCPITLGTTAGTIDAAQVILTSIETQLSTATGKLGLTPAQLTSSFFASGAAVGNITAGSLLASLLASGAAQTNLGIVNAAAIITPASIVGTLIAGNTITGTLLATTGIITLSAQIGTAVVADANIAALAVTKLTGGTITAALIEVGITGSGVITDITQGVDSSFGGRNFGIQLRNSSTAARIDVGYDALYVINGSNLPMFTLVSSSGGLLNCCDTSGNATVTLDGPNSQMYVSHVGLGQRVLLGSDGSNNGHILVNGTQVISTRVVSTPATLADVIAALQHHGLTN